MFLLSFPVHAHKLSAFAALSNEGIQGKVYYPTGAAPGQKVQLVDSNGNVLADTISDADGRFTFPTPEKLPATVVSETVDGHRAEFTVGAENAALAAKAVGSERETTGQSIPEERIRAIVQEELRPLREQLAEQAGRTRARDIFGGIGYIAGVFGLIVMLRPKPGKRK